MAYLKFGVPTSVIESANMSDRCEFSVTCSAEDYLQACLKAEPILAEAASAAAVAADTETAALAKVCVFVSSFDNLTGS